MRTRPGSSLSGGFTLVEVMVVLALSAVVTLGIVAFYLTAQQTWTDSSSQALAQRDATTILETLADKAHAADTVVVKSSAGDPANSQVGLYQGKILFALFDCKDDSLLHQGDVDLQDIGPVTSSKIMRFHASYIDSLKLLVVDSLRVRSSSGQQVTQSSAFGLLNAKMRAN